MLQDIIRDFSEKRDFIRMRVDTEITLRPADSNQPIRAVCRDLSGTGMLIEVGEAIEEGTVLFACIPSNNEAFPSLESTVKIIRCSPLENGNYQLGTEIVNIQS